MAYGALTCKDGDGVQILRVAFPQGDRGRLQPLAHLNIALGSF